MDKNIEQIILRNIQYNDEFARKVIPHMKSEYFSDYSERLYFENVVEYFNKYNALPTSDAISIELQKLKVSEDQIKALSTLQQEIDDKKDEQVNADWLIESTETFCKDRALFNALMNSISIAEGEKTNNEMLSTTAIPEILSEALGVSFNTSIGHDYIDDAEERYDFYQSKERKMPCHLEMLNKVTQGGFERKTCNCLVAGTGVGKSMMLGDLAANYIKDGYNVLYITMEMAEEKIAQRIDANLMNVDVERVISLDKETYMSKISSLRKKCTGKLIVQEYPNGGAHVGHFRHLIRELKQKRKFVADIIVVDYVNICASSRFKDKSNSYGYVKSICEELRGLAVSEKVMMLTATQLNRGGQDNTDVSLENISESMGGPMTFDSLFAIISNEELAASQQVMFKQLKNRFGDLFIHNKFTVGVDRPKMKFYDLNNSSMSTVQKITPKPAPASAQRQQSSSNSKSKFSGITV